MANEEHRNILRQGVAAWNIWRERNPHIVPNLDDSTVAFYSSDPDLSHINFRGASLINTQFENAKLIGADFRETNLELLIMKKSDCSGADFSLANLNLANIQTTNLTNADFTGATSIQATIKNCDLTGAKLSPLIKVTLLEYSGLNKY